MLHKSLVLLGALALFVLAACSAPSIPTAADAQKAVCQSLSRVAAGVDRLAAVNPQTKVAELKALKSQLDGVMQSVRTANTALNIAAVGQMVTAYDGLATQLNGLADNATIDDATAARIKQAVAGMQDSITQASAGLKCTPQ